MERRGQLIFACAFVLALALYALTAPHGLPWNGSTHLAMAYLGETVRFPEMPYPVWGFHVQVFYGPVVLSVIMAALAAGLLAALVNRRLGWRFAVGAALTWTFLPGVWDRAVTGQRGVCLAAMAVVAAWGLNAVLPWILRKVRKAWQGGDGSGTGDGPAVSDARRDRMSRIAGWTVLGVSVVFVFVSLAQHDYLLGEAAGVFARGVVDAAGDRVIVLDGTVDDQIVRESKSRRTGKAMRHDKGKDVAIVTVSLRTDEAYRTNLVARVRAAFPAETNLWVAARVGAAAFVAAATEKWPDRFYYVGGRSTSVEQWERRWTDFRPYLESTDPFVRVGRRLFAAEGNVIANAMLGAKGTEVGEVAARRAWQLYKRIYGEVDPGNFSALVNLGEMVRCGQAAGGEEAKRFAKTLERAIKEAGGPEGVRGLVRAAGPVRADLGRPEKPSAEENRRIAMLVAAGGRTEVAPDALSLAEWTVEMAGLADRGELTAAGRIARTILANPDWRGCIPANAVMGAVTADEGDYVASEFFYRTVTDLTNDVSATVLNGYADTLMRLGKTAEAERMARRGVGKTDETNWAVRLTLAKVLVRKSSADGLFATSLDADAGRSLLQGSPTGSVIRSEIRALLKSVLRHAPVQVREEVRRGYRELLR